MDEITATREELAAVFEEWVRRYYDEPERFSAEYGEPVEYGVGCADYFLRLHGEIGDAS
jgi:hypothetical protein